MLVHPLSLSGHHIFEKEKNIVNENSKNENVKKILFPPSQLSLASAFNNFHARQ